MPADLILSDVSLRKWFSQNHPAFKATCTDGNKLVQAERVLWTIEHYGINLLFLDTKKHVWGFNQADFCKLIDLYYQMLDSNVILKSDIIQYRQKLAHIGLTTIDLFRSFQIVGITDNNCKIDNENNVIRFSVSSLHYLINLLSILMEKHD